MGKYVLRYVQAYSIGQHVLPPCVLSSSCFLVGTFQYITGTVGKVPYPAYPGYIPGVFHTRVRVGIVGMTSENT